MTKVNNNSSPVTYGATRAACLSPPSRVRLNPSPPRCRARPASPWPVPGQYSSHVIMLCSFPKAFGYVILTRNQ